MPFPAIVLNAAVNNVKCSIEDSPREVRIIYSNPIHREILDEDPYWVRAAEYAYPRTYPVMMYQPR